MNFAAVSTALLAAILFGWSTALMHQSASTAPGNPGTVALLRYLIGQWRWLLGMVASLSGLAVHVWALGLGSIAVVQPLVVTGLAFSFVFRAALDRQLLPRHELGWVLLTTVGLALFLLNVGDTEGNARADTGRVVLMLVVGGTVALVALLLSLRQPPAKSGFLLGLCGGVVFGLIAGTLKAATDVVSSGTPIWASWPVYVVVPLGVAGFLTNQRAYHHAPLTVSLPVLNLLNPAVAIVFGIVAFGEHTSGDALHVVLAGIGLAGVLAGIFFLARQPERPTAPPTDPPAALPDLPPERATVGGSAR